MDISSLFQYTFSKVVETFSHNWLLLLISIVISVALKLYVDQDTIARFLRRNTKNSVLMSTGLAMTGSSSGAGPPMMPNERDGAFGEGAMRA